MGNAVTPETLRCDGLPPRPYWLISPNQQIQTPTDSRGLVVVDELVESVKAYIDPSFDWSQGPPADIHHLYFTEAFYKFFQDQSKGRIPAYDFREQAANKIYTPRLFHNVLHRVTAPAPMPSTEVMHNFIEAWTVARNLFASVSKAVRAEVGRRKLDKKEPSELELARIDQEISAEVLSRHFGEIRSHLGELTLIPYEYRPLQLDGDVRGSASQLCSVLEHGQQRRAGSLVLPNLITETCSCLHCKLNSSIITSVIN